MKERITKLLEVKSIVTLTLTGAATYGFIVGTVPVELFATWFGAVITYFFAKRSE
jgi:uncharacterized membrane protein YdjX (TVP38/TMEM64 family)